jgi:branched-chain amino acid transport system substrate-binding protein
VWFLAADARTIARIDPKTQAVTGRIQSPRNATDMAAGAGAVWVGTGGGAGGNWTHKVLRLDPVTGAVTGTAKMPSFGTGGDRIDLNGGFPQIAIGAGAVWATGGGGVARIDPRTGARVKAIEVGASRLAAGPEGVWFISSRDAGVVTPIDPRTNRTRRVVDVGDATLSGIAVGGGSVWVTAEQEGIVFRISAGADHAVTPIDAGRGVNYIAYGAGTVWVANYVKGVLTRIDPRTNAVTGETPIGAVQSLAAGAGSAWVSTAGATRAGTLPASVCHDETPAGTTPDVLIASDLPLQDVGDPPDVRALGQAIRTVLAEHGFRAGKYTIGYRSCDDSTRQAGAFEPRRCAANANAYATADRLVAVIGPENSGCAHVELPILNRAPGGPLAVISPSNSDVGLTRPGVPPPWGYRGSPDIYYPIGIRHYMRLTSPETLMGSADAELAKQLGVRRAFVLDDGDEYFKTTFIDPFRKTARRVGVGIAGTVRFDPERKRVDAVAEQVARSGADGVLLSGFPFANTPRLLKAVRAKLGADVPVMVNYGFASIATDELFHEVGPGLRGVYVTTLDVQHGAVPLTEAGRRIARVVEAHEPNVLETAQATELVLRAIERSDGTRASVLAHLRTSKVTDGILGSFAFDDKGDMTPGFVPILRFTRPSKQTAAHLKGAVVDRVLHPRPSAAD